MKTSEQMQKMTSQPGFIAALDQSGGSTPHALALYGIRGHAWKDDDEMFELVHQMRTRVITSPSFTGERILGAILFEDTMDRDIKGQPTADYLWNVKGIVPFLKVDNGLQPEKDGIQLMKPMTELAALLDKGKTKHVFGTKMRSVIKRANPAGIKKVVHQQFEVAGQIIDTGLVPIIEPEVDIHCPQKAKAEALLKEAILEKLNGLPAGQQVLLKLTLPEQADFYTDCIRHPRVVRVLALSGGYTQELAIARLRENHGVVASFSRALLEGLSVRQTDAEFNATLNASIQRIYGQRPEPGTGNPTEVEPPDNGPLAQAKKRQKEAWQAGRNETVEQLLAAFPELQSDRKAILDLIFLEILRRDKNRESPTEAEYCKRFPALSAKVADIFRVCEFKC
jgi:fructose-bisphosphate aldolase class I